ncbi:hypothetical protein ACLOJK_034811 [Asimina triloba]
MGAPWTMLAGSAAALIATVLPYDRMVNGLIGDGFCGLDRSGSWVQICPNHFVVVVRSRWVRPDGSGDSDLREAA